MSTSEAAKIGQRTQLGRNPVDELELLGMDHEHFWEAREFGLPVLQSNSI